MRAGPLSDRRVAALLNRHFVPVYISNEDYAKKKGTASAEEQAERLRIFREGHKAKLSVGTVHAYILTADGRPVDSLHVATAAKVDRLLDMLERNVEKLRAPAGEPVIKPGRQAAPPAVEAGGLLLHLTARVIKGGAWGGIPGENWLALDGEETKSLLPRGNVAVGTGWEIPSPTAARLLVYFYPATENNDVRKNKIERQSLRGKVLSVKDGVARARLDGDLRMRHDFYHKEDGRRVEASLVGYIDFEPATGRVRAFRLVTERAAYNGGTFGVAVRSVEAGER